MKLQIIIILCTFLTGCFSASEQKIHAYYTWDGLEPDRWSSIWLLKRHVDPLAEISILPVGAQISGATAVVTPKSSIKRTHGFSNFDNMVKAYGKTDDKGLIRIGRIINELEISPWASSTPAVAIVEEQFRALQFMYNRVDVPDVCYVGFFDALYDAVKNEALSDNKEYLDSLHVQLEPDSICKIQREAIVKKTNVLVPEYPVDYVLKMINANKKVVFVDTREDNEFDEHHIPGAINLKLREVNTMSAKQFEDADLVISYCIKDFRGYEVAFALNKVGLKNVGIMKPYGLKGWKDLGLPVANNEIPDAIAIDLLKKKAASGV